MKMMRPFRHGNMAKQTRLLNATSSMSSGSRVIKKCLKIMQTKMSEVIRASIPEKDVDGVAHTAAEFLAIVERQHDTRSKTYASTLINKLTSL
jgi:hypothetical protein